MVDPISQLVQLQQAKKEKEPIFTVLSERGIPRQPEFVVQVTAGSLTATGIGPKKKEAKRAAALKILELLGVASEVATVQPERQTDLSSSNLETSTGGKRRCTLLGDNNLSIII